jgi:protein tyrosine/serine phosphatase
MLKRKKNGKKERTSTEHANESYNDSKKRQNKNRKGEEGEMSLLIRLAATVRGGVLVTGRGAVGCPQVTTR